MSKDKRHNVDMFYSMRLCKHCQPTLQQCNTATDHI